MILLFIYTRAWELQRDFTTTSSGENIFRNESL